ncbi:hypothetical protein MAR_032390 [Mya arenaria]|uniref:Uncharacterized protein n=1 Tax=Mya arenaria TaxID=6604 RepID=A0ABY7FAH2_MYAAR|nr:hypothetical protein MAR_032390 [Mya arenaria]
MLTLFYLTFTNRDIGFGIIFGLLSSVPIAMIAQFIATSAQTLIIVLHVKKIGMDLRASINVELTVRMASVTQRKLYVNITQAIYAGIQCTDCGKIWISMSKHVFGRMRQQRMLWNDGNMFLQNGLDWQLL